MYDKPWMRPCEYVDAAPRDTLRGEQPLEGDTDPVSGIPVVAGDRRSVKPTSPTKDTAPMRYTPASKVKNIFGVDDNDEPDSEEPDTTPETY